jgi:hypothetical protein
MFVGGAKGMIYFHDLDVDERIVLKWLSGGGGSIYFSGVRSLAGSCEYGIRSSVSMALGEFID